MAQGLGLPQSPQQKSECFPAYGKNIWTKTTALSPHSTRASAPPANVTAQQLAWTPMTLLSDVKAMSGTAAKGSWKASTTCGSASRHYKQGELSQNSGSHQIRPQAVLVVLKLLRRAAPFCSAY